MFVISNEMLLILSEVATGDVLKEKVFSKISQISQENTCAGVSFLIKLQACNFIKKTLQHNCFPVKYAKFLMALF